MGLFNKKKKEDIAASPAEGSPAKVVAEALSDDELIAVISAAISAYGADQFRQTLCIRKLDRAAGTRPAWGVTGTNEAIDMRRM